MGDWTDLNEVDMMKLARSIERDCQEAVKWEIRKLQWIREERAKVQAETKSDAA